MTKSSRSSKRSVEETGLYNVEKILSKRDKNGSIEYYVKWENYGSIHNTWEPVENFDPALLEDFERSLVSKKPKKKNSLNDLDVEKMVSPCSSVTFDNPNIGFNRGLEPDKIIGATDESITGELMFLMKWKDSDEADLVFAKKANKICPQIVIKFYEERLTWGIMSN